MGTRKMNAIRIFKMWRFEFVLKNFDPKPWSKHIQDVYVGTNYIYTHMTLHMFFKFRMGAINSWAWGWQTKLWFERKNKE